MTGTLDAGIGNEKRPRLDLVRGVCRIKAAVPSYNIFARPRWSSSHARLPAFPRVRE